jgi:hypothetical protein
MFTREPKNEQPTDNDQEILPLEQIDHHRSMIRQMVIKCISTFRSLCEQHKVGVSTKAHQTTTQARSETHLGRN